MKKEYENFAKYNLQVLKLKEIITNALLSILCIWVISIFPYQTLTLPLWTWGYILGCIVIGMIALFNESMWQGYFYRACTFGGGSIVYVFLSYKNKDLVTYGILNSLLIYFYLGGYALYLFMIINLIKKLIKRDEYSKERPSSYPLGYLGGALALVICPIFFSKVNTGTDGVIMILAVLSLLLGLCYGFTHPLFYKAYLLRKIEKASVD